MTKNNWLIWISALFIIAAVYEALLNRPLLVSITLLAIPISCYLVFWNGTDEDDWKGAEGTIITDIKGTTINDIVFFAAEAERKAAYLCDGSGVIASRVKSQAQRFDDLRQKLDNISIRVFKSAPLVVSRRSCNKKCKEFVDNATKAVNRLDVCQSSRAFTAEDREYMEALLARNETILHNLREDLKFLGGL